jgi:hypothetical protein
MDKMAKRMATRKPTIIMTMMEMTKKYSDWRFLVVCA